MNQLGDFCGGCWPKKKNGPHSAGQKVLKERLPFLLDGFAHLIEIKGPVVHVGDGGDHALCLQRPEFVVQQTFDDMRRHLHLGKLRGKCPSQVEDLPRRDLAGLLKLPLGFALAVPGADHTPAGEEQIGAVEAGNGLKDGRGHFAVGEVMLGAVLGFRQGYGAPRSIDEAATTRDCLAPARAPKDRELQGRTERIADIPGGSPHGDQFRIVEHTSAGNVLRRRPQTLHGGVLDIARYAPSEEYARVLERVPRLAGRRLRQAIRHAGDFIVRDLVQTLVFEALGEIAIEHPLDLIPGVRL